MLLSSTEKVHMDVPYTALEVGAFCAYTMMQNVSTYLEQIIDFLTLIRSNAWSLEGSGGALTRSEHITETSYDITVRLREEELSVYRAST